MTLVLATPQRQRLGDPERLALGTALVAVAGFGVYGWATGAPSTVAYVLTVLIVGTVVCWCWNEATPPWVAVALAVLAAGHLAGGLVRVGNDVLYNAWLGSPVLRYDHVFHSSAVFLGTIVLWTTLVPPTAALPRRRRLVALCVLAGLGLGAVNETIEFLTTMAHHGAHVGGYDNTGWDLVSNVVGALAAGLYVSA